MKFTSVLAFTTVLTSTGQVKLPEVVSDEQEYDAENKRFIATGNAELTHDDLYITSDRMVLDQKSVDLNLSGTVQITKNKFRILGDQANYKYLKKDFAFEQFRFGRAPINAEGDSVKGNLDLVEIENGTLYFDEPDKYSLNVKAKSITVEDQKTLKLESAVFHLGPVPLFKLPTYTQNIEQGSPLRLKGDIGYRSKLGAHVQSKILYRTNETLKLGANIDAYSKRGFLIGPVAEYESSLNKENRFSGDLNTGFINDNGSNFTRGLDLLGNPIDDSRFFVEWRHRQSINDSLDITGSLSWWSDSEVERDFREDLFDDNQRPDSFVESVYRGENYLVSAFLRSQLNDFQLVGQRLPEIRFDLLPIELFETGIYERFNSSFAHLVKRDPTGINSKQETSRFNVYYGLSRPTQINSWLTWVPVAGFNLTHYTDPLTRSGTYTRLLGEVGFDLEATMHAIWDYQNEFWDINGLRHQLTPVLQYRYIPEADRETNIIPKVDQLASIESYLNPIGLGNKRNIDDLSESNLIRLGLENVLQTRHSEYGSRDLLSLDLYQDIRFSERTGQNDLSDLHAHFTLTPAYWLKLQSFSRFDPERLTLRELRTRLRFIDGEQWGFYVGNDFVKSTPFLDAFGTPRILQDIKQYNFGFDYKINERNAVRAEWRIDSELNEITEQVYAWNHKVGHSWDIEFQVGYLQGSTREDDFQFRIRIDLLTF